MKPRFKGAELILAKMLFKTVFQLNGEVFPEDAAVITRGTDTISAIYDTEVSSEQCFIDLSKQTVTKSSYQRVNLLKNDSKKESEPPAVTPQKPTEEEPAKEPTAKAAVQVATTKEPIADIPLPLPVEPIESIPTDYDQEEKSEAEKLLPTAISAVEERTALIRQVNKYNEPSDLYINPDGTICYPNNVESDCIGRVFDSSLSEDDKDELLDLLYGQLNNVEVYEPSNVLVVHI